LPGEQLGSQAAEEYVVGHIGLGMRLKALPLKVLHRVDLARVRVRLGERLADRVAKGRQSTVLLPEGEEVAADVVPSLGEVDAAGRVVGLRRQERRLALPPGRDLVTEQAEQHVVALRELARVPLEAGAFEPLGDIAGGWIGVLLSDRVTEDGQAAEPLPVGPKTVAEVVLRLREGDAGRVRAGRSGLGSDLQC